MGIISIIFYFQLIILLLYICTNIHVCTAKAGRAGDDPATEA